jgi:hypothetical protein
MLEHAIAYIDEAGRLADPRDRYVALAAVVTSNARELRQVVKNASRRQKQVRLKKIDGREVKWSNASDRVRQLVLSALNRRDARVFWLVVDKEGQSIIDTPENYGRLVAELVQECLAYYPNLYVVLDIHFGSPTQRKALNRVLQERLALAEEPEQLDSQTDSVIQVADFVAGAILSQAMGRGHWADLIAEHVVVGKTVKWRKPTKKK